jgi:hypothetical protein
LIELPANGAGDVADSALGKCAQRIRDEARAVEWTHSLAVCRSRGAQSHALKIVLLGSIHAGSSDHEVIEHHAIGRAAKLLEEFRRSKLSGDGGKHIQLGLLIFF